MLFGRHMLRRFGNKLASNRLASQVRNASLREVLQEYRLRGHLYARLDPLEMTLRQQPPQFEQVIDIPSDGITIAGQVCRDSQSIVRRLEAIYAGTIGYEIGMIEDHEESQWLIEMIETASTMNLSGALQSRLGRLLVESETFDRFMAKRYGQVKRYGLEGAETMLVAIDTIFRSMASHHAHVVIGMPHRGRLNLLTGLLGFPAEAIFHKMLGESELSPSVVGGTGDVLSHLSKGNVGSAVNPVTVGCAYGLKAAFPIQIHGDAAFAGQRICMETLQLSKLAGWDVGGSIHLIVNNQIGFTALPKVGRSSRYASDPVKMINAPVFHVNADDPINVSRAAFVACKYRERFRKDVVIDLVGYRRHGHNELDEPAFTQPALYQAIEGRSTVGKIFQEQLEAGGVWKKDIDAEAIAAEYNSKLEAAMKRAKDYVPKEFQLQASMKFEWTWIEGSSTGVSADRLARAAKESVKIPLGFQIHPRLLKHHVQARLDAIQSNKPAIDWATAEAMAVGSLLEDGKNVRWVGQDVSRGTFSHRHWEFHDQTQHPSNSVIPLAGISPGKLMLHNSCLSELAVLGFEYGLNIATADQCLGVWEAQFGDFFNGAQVIFDTFLSSGAAKWGIQSGQVILLPHGYDGTGPEHSSCRLERFLQSSFEGSADGRTLPNWSVVNPTTPANYFHLLRRQLARPYRIPLIVVAPKTLLRLPAATSALTDMTEGTMFRPVLDDPLADASTTKHLVFVSGKVYYDLVKERADHSMALIRIEELCPFPYQQLKGIIERYVNCQRATWFQEEPRNMGAYEWAHPRIQSVLPKNIVLDCVSRDPSAAVATGIGKEHKEQIKALLTNLFK